VTLAVIAITHRYPVTRALWKKHLAIHALSAVVLAFVANVLVVIAYQLMSGSLGSVMNLVTQGATWMAVRLHIALMIYAAIAAMTQIAVNYRDARATELRTATLETQLARARLEALNAQIRPHFLFNTMHTIGQLWRAGRHDEAEQVLDSLGALFHRVHDSTSQMEVPLGEELALVREYLAIEGTRYRDRLTPVIEAPADVLSAKVPALLLQPLVENAVRHGISAISTASLIEVSASRDNGTLRLTVRDDGPGPQAPSAHRGSGTGIRNTRERLSQLYGERARLDITAAVNGGTLVTVELPFSTTGVLNGG
jgi:two-component system LytT family sensor kinase